MIEPRCLIRTDASTGSFPDDFAGLGKWFRQPGRSFRSRSGTKNFTGLRVEPSRASWPFFLGKHLFVQLLSSGVKNGD